MKAKQRHSVISRLAEIQHLHVARERLQLVEAQFETSAAEEDVQNTGAVAEEATAALDNLLSAPSFCPLNYSIACQALLIAEAEKGESEQNLVSARETEQQQRISWHQSRQKATFLEDAASALSKKLARADDDRRALHASAISQFSVSRLS